MDLERSPLALPFPAMPPIAGATPRIARAGYKDWGRCDLTYLEFAEGTAVAGVFTQNVCCSSEVELGREQVKAGSARALVVNAGNSNAFTGYRGREAVEQIMGQVAAHLGCAPSEVFVSSTGVIGVPLPKDKAQAGVAAVLEAAACSWEEAAATIGTTDTFAKGATATAVVGGKTVTIASIIKGSGMIAPDMATMLGYIVHRCGGRARLPAATALRPPTGSTFSCITVDSDTSTSDTVLAFATGKAGQRPAHLLRQTPAPMPSPRRCTTSAASSPSWWCATAKARRSSSPIDVTGAVSDESARKIGLADRQLAADQDRDRRRGRQLGPRGDGGRQGRRTRRPRQALDRLRRRLGGEATGSRSPITTRRRSPRI